MEDKKTILKRVIISTILGGIALGIFTLIAEFFSYGLAGYLAGTVPIVITFMIIYTYVTGTHKKMVSTAWLASISCITYIIYCVVFALISTYLVTNSGLNLGVSLIVALIIWVSLNILLIKKILPSYGVNLFDKNNENKNLIGSNLIDKARE